MADLNFQLIQQLLMAIANGASGAIEQGTTPKAIAQCVAEFWDAAACGIWDGHQHQLAWYSHDPNLPEPIDHQLPPETTAYQGKLQSTFPNGYLMLIRPEKWPDEANLDDIAVVVSIGLQQYALQQEVRTAQQTLRQAQVLADERTAQLQSSQGLLTKLQAAGRRRVEQLDEANRLKDEFISAISHELRTPLTSMSLAIKMLRQPGIDSDRQTRYLDILQQQCAQEINLINDLLTIQQFETNQADFDRQLIILESLLAPLIARFQETWASKNLQLKVLLPSNLQWYTDGESLTRILQELLTNAGKYAHPETIVELTAEQVAGNVVLKVIDRGKLITAADLPYIFQKFRRGKGMTQQAVAGTGLGLALVKSLVQHLQGEVSVTSTGNEPLAETCFQVSLPLEES
jgi:signal transduction histidine kinase